MPRGSRPGERRGGRQRGTPNKKTLLKNAVFLAAASEPNRSPLDFMLALMRDPQVPFDTRIEMAATAAPFVHARPESTRKKRPDPLDLGNRLAEPGESRDLKFETSDTKSNAGEGSGLTPVDFLLGVMSDPAAAPRQRVKSAAIAARYKHPYAGGGEAPSIIVAEDKFGFKIDAELARAERDDRLRERRLGEFKKGSADTKAAEPELEEIRKRRADRVALVKFPENYTYGDQAADQKRLQELYSKRCSRKKLTPEEEAEEAHLAVRVLSPVPVPKSLQPAPEMEWPMSRIAELEERVVGGETLAAAEDHELKDLRGRYPEIAAEVDRLDHRYRYCVRRETEKAQNWDEYEAARDKCERLRDPRKMATVEDLRSGPVQRIYRLEVRRFDEKLTPEEADELEELHRWYRERAERTRNLVVRRLSEYYAMRDYTRQLGFDPGPDEGWPRI